MPETAETIPRAADRFLGEAPGLLHRGILYVLIGALAALLGWAWITKIDLVVNAPAKLIPRGQVLAVTAVHKGEVRELLAREGQRVKKGQVLAVIESREKRREEVEVTRAQDASDEARRELAVRFPARKKLAENKVATLRREGLALATRLQAVQTALADDLRSLKQKLAAKTGEIEALAARGRLQQRVLDLAGEELKNKQRLAGQGAPGEKGGIISQRDVEQAEVVKVKAELDLETSRAQLAAARAEKGQLELELETLGRRNQAERATLEGQAAAVESRIAEEQVGLAREEHRLARELETARAALASARFVAGSDSSQRDSRVVAPVDGIVTELSVRRTGEQVTEGQVLARLAPREAELLAEIYVANKDAGRIPRPGRGRVRVKLKFDAFPFQDYGVVHGRLVWIAPDATRNEKLGPVYRGEVELDERLVSSSRGEAHALQFGLEAAAEIVVGRRRLISLVLDPFQKLRASLAED